MKVENLEIGKAYVHKNAECLVLDQLPVWHNNNTYVFVDPKEPQLNIQYLKAEDVNNFITELEIEKPEVPNFRPDHYTSLPFKLDEVQETIAENCFRAFSHLRLCFSCLLGLPYGGFKMTRKNYFNAMLQGSLIMGLNQTYGEHPVMGWITKLVLLMFIIICIYVNLRDDD